MGLSNNEARVHVELLKDPKSIEEAVQEVATYIETTSGDQVKHVKTENLEKSKKKIRQVKKNSTFQKQNFQISKKQENKQGQKNESEKDLISLTKDKRIYKRCLIKCMQTSKKVKKLFKINPKWDKAIHLKRDNTIVKTKIMRKQTWVEILLKMFHSAIIVVSLVITPETATEIPIDTLPTQSNTMRNKAILLIKINLPPLWQNLRGTL